MPGELRVAADPAHRPPRFNFEKFSGSNDRLTTRMKSVGEVMAIGPAVPESFQKALRGMETGTTGLNPKLVGPLSDEQLRDLQQELRMPGPDRLLYLADAMRLGIADEELSRRHQIEIDEYKRNIDGLRKIRDDLLAKLRAGEVLH